MAAAQTRIPVQSPPLQASNVLQKKCDTCRKERPFLHHAHSGPGPGTVPPIVHEALREPGQPLDSATWAFCEPQSGHDFSRVRVHTDSKAAESAKAVNARAYPGGSHNIFGGQQDTTDDRAGIRLMAHEPVHIAQQPVVTAGPVQAREAAGRESPPGEVEAERRGQFSPDYPGCGSWQRRRIEFQLTMARAIIRDGILGLQDELTRSPGGIITIAGSALNGQFHTRDPGHIRTIITRLGGIQTMLNRGPRNIRCVTSSGCRMHCSSRAMACAGPAHPIRVCPLHFEHSDHVGTLNLVHEAAHQSGRGLSGGPGHYYSHDARFVNLTTAQAMNNPDSYALFVRDHYYGGPIVSSRGAGAAPEAPHEREARSVEEGRSWSPRDLTLYFSLEEPAVQANMGWSEGRMQQVPAAGRRVRDRFKGDVAFFVDAAGGSERRRPYPAPSVSARMTLHRMNGRPARSVLLDVSDDRARDTGVGSSLRTRFNKDFDFRFIPSDRGTLHVEVRMQDFDTATTIVYRDSFIVRP